MKDLALHDLTRRQLNDFIKSPAHAVALISSAGGGKRTLAIRLAETVLGLPANGFDAYAYKMTVADDEGKAIGIESVREIERFLSLKVPAQGEHNRTVIIENAHLMTTEAQNAFLKTLEEPPAGTFIILTAGSEQALLPTIRSRVQFITVKRPAAAAVQDYFKAAGFDEREVSRAYAVSGGLPGLMRALLEQADHPLVEATDYARRILSQPVYERLTSVDELSKRRQLSQDVLFILQQMSRVSLQTATGRSAAKWQAVLTASYQASEALILNAQPKLVLTNLMLSF